MGHDIWMKYDHRIYMMNTGCIRPTVLAISWQLPFDEYIKTD